MDLSTKILSDITVHMKYAKYLPELKRRETWEELVTRNKQMHQKKYPHITNEIEDAYKYVYAKKILPSMRSLQFGGKPIEISPNRIYNCFGRETEFITEYGLKSFKDFEDGDEIRVLTHTGTYKKAVVRNYGKQVLWTTTFKRGRSTKTIRVTDNHRWLLYDGSETTNLQLNQPLYPTTKVDSFDYNSATPMERLYWCYGYVFGDGTTLKKSGEDKYSMVRLCGNDALQFLYRFKEMGFETSTSNSLEGDIMVYTGKYLKTAPSIEVDGLPMIKAFMDGYLSADGSKNPDWYENNSLSKYKAIQSSQKDHQEFLEKYLDVCGYYITNKEDLTGQITNYGVRPETYRYGITTHIGSRPNTAWSATEFRPVASEEDVWCLEVEEDRSFVLGGGIVTGNCGYLPVDDWRAFSEIMFLLLGGTGVGFSVQKHHIEELPEIRKPNPSRFRRYLIGDSIEGWADAIKILMRSYFEGMSTPEFDYSDIRPKGALLVTSGGKAPGPQPLKDCVHNIKKILDAKEDGSKLEPIECHDIVCFIADAVLTGGIRRAALISLFSLDDEEMLSAKSGAWWELNPQRGRANNSAVILRHKITEDKFFHLWKKIEDSNAGEPGVYFSNDKDWGTNPSLRAGTKVLTTDGIFPIEELQDKNFNVKNLNGKISEAKCWLSGKNQQLIKLTLKDGTNYFATKEHEWPVWNGEKYIKVKTPNLKRGDLLPFLRETKLFDGTIGTYNDGFLCGWLTGDGWISKRKEYSEYGMIVSDKDDENKISELLVETIKDNVPTFSGAFTPRYRTTFEDFEEEITQVLVETGTKEISINNKKVDEYITKFGVYNKENGLPLAVWQDGTEEFRKGLIDGLFSSDGHVSLDKKRITLTSKHNKLVQDVSELLGFYGIKTTIKESIGVLNGDSFTRFDLRIHENQSIKQFISLFKLSVKHKQDRLENYIFKNTTDNNQVEVLSVEETDIYEDVWDISVFDETHCFQLSKVVTGNCCEIGLRPFQFCNLCEVNVSDIESQEDLENRAKAAAFIGTLQAGYTNFHYLRDVWKRTTEKDALIGVGMTGIGSGEILKYNLELAAKAVLKENARVAKLIGINKSARTNTVKPSGTSSLVLGTASGIHAWHNDYYIRRIRVGKNESIYTYLSIYHPELIEDEYFKPKDQAVISLPVKAPEGSIFRFESPMNLLDRVSKFNKEWVRMGHRDGQNTHNVSVTVSIKKEAEKVSKLDENGVVVLDSNNNPIMEDRRDDDGNIIYKINEWPAVGKWMWDNRDNFNGISVLPYDGGSYIQAPFEDCNKEKYEKMMEVLSDIDLTKVVELSDSTNLTGELACANGGCEILS